MRHPPIIRKDTYIEATLTGKNCPRWNYPFDKLEVGDQMRCPIDEGDNAYSAQARILRASRHFRFKGNGHMKWKTQQKEGYILVERIA